MAVEFKTHAGTIQKLSEIGANHIRALRKFIEFRGLKLTEDSLYASPHCLDVSFFGLRLLFRVEITLNPVETNGALANCEIKGAIVAYRFSGPPLPKIRSEDPLQDLGVRYPFTPATQGYFGVEPPAAGESGRDCSGRFFDEIFEKLVATKSVLKP